MAIASNLSTGFHLTHECTFGSIIMSVAIPIRTNELGTRYFTPRFVNIVVGETITWYNAGKDIHSLIFDIEIPPYDIKIGAITPVGTY